MIASLALSLLAAKTMSHKVLFGGISKALIFMLGLSLAMLVIVAFYQFDLVSKPNPLFGGLDLKSARHLAMLSIGQTLVVGLVLLAIVKLVIQPHWRAGLFLSVVAVELIVANHWLVPQANSDSFESLVDLQSASAEANYLAPTFAGQNEFPVEWSNTSSERRLDEIVLWQRENVYGKHHLEFGCRRLGSFTSIEPENACRLLDLSRGSLHRSKELPSCWFVEGDVDIDKLDYRWGASGLVGWLRHKTYLVEGKVESISCNQFRVDANVPSSGFIVANTAADDGWKVAVQSQNNSELIEDAEFSFSDLLAGARVPKGDVEVTFTYSPIEFWVGMWISIVSWLLFVLFLFVRIGRKPSASGT